MLGLVALTGGTSANKVLHQAPQVGEVEVAAESVYGALDAFMAIIVSGSQDQLQQWRCWWNVQATIKHNHTVEHGPRRGVGARANLLLESDEGGIGGLRLA